MFGQSNSIIGGGIFLTLLVSFWEKLRNFFWSMTSFLICRFEFHGGFSKYGQIYIWDKLKNKKSLSPIYNWEIMGSGKESKMFIREVGFKNPRIVFFGKIPTIATIDDVGRAVVYGLKPFINHEIIMTTTLKHYDDNYVDLKNNESRSRFITKYIRGSLSENNSNKAPVEPGEDQPSEEVTGNSNLSFQEQYDIGRRINYTAEEYRQYITFTKENVKMIDNLFLTKNMTELKLKLERWFDHKDWFMDRSIQWKRGVLLHGLPGTGKTSFIVALAEYFKVPIYIFDLATFTNSDLDRQWNKAKYSTPCFVVFEDFDSVFDVRENIYAKNSVMSKPLSFDCILNILDGAVKFDGVVTFITTNNIDKIDSALGGGGRTRPGRIDYVYEMNKIGVEGREFIADKIFKDMERKEALKEFVLSQETDTPAQFKELCINTALEEYQNRDIKVH